MDMLLTCLWVDQNVIYVSNNVAVQNVTENLDNKYSSPDSKQIQNRYLRDEVRNRQRDVNVQTIEGMSNAW